MRKKIACAAVFMGCLIGIVMAAGEADRKLAILISRSNWNNIPANVKQQGKAVLDECTTAPISFRLDWIVRHKVNTNTIFGIAIYGKNAQALRSKIGSGFTPAKMQQLKDAWESYGGYIVWSDDVKADLALNNLEYIPGPDEVVSH